MKRATDHKLRSALSDLVAEDEHLRIAQAARDEAQRAYWHAQTRRNTAAANAATLLEAEGGIVMHDGQIFERLGLQKVRIAPIARDLPVVQEALPLDGAAHG